MALFTMVLKNSFFKVDLGLAYMNLSMPHVFMVLQGNTLRPKMFRETLSEPEVVLVYLPQALFLDKCIKYELILGDPKTFCSN